MGQTVKSSDEIAFLPAFFISDLSKVARFPSLYNFCKIQMDCRWLVNMILKFCVMLMNSLTCGESMRKSTSTPNIYNDCATPKLLVLQ